MPSAPTNPLRLPIPHPKEVIQDIRRKIFEYDTALDFAFNKLGLLLFQQLVGNTFTGDILAQKLQDSWDTMLSKNTNRDSKYIQLHTRVDLSPLAETDILDGEDVVKPMRFNTTTMKEEPVKITVGYIMMMRSVKFRRAMDQMLQDMGIGGLCVLIFPARNMGKHIPWTYDVKIAEEALGKAEERALEAEVEVLRRRCEKRAASTAPGTRGGEIIRDPTLFQSPNIEPNTKKNDLIKTIKELEKRYSSAIHRNEHYEAESVLDTLNRFKSQLPGNEPNFIINEEGLVKPWD